MSNLIFVCTSCDSDKPVPAGRSPQGAMLAAKIRDTINTTGEDDWTVREVACLNGCLKPCNISFRGADRFTFRFSQVMESDAATVLAFGVQYWGSDGGGVEVEKIPAALRAKLTVYTPPRGRWQ